MNPRTVAASTVHPQVRGPSSPVVSGARSASARAGCPRTRNPAASHAPVATSTVTRFMPPRANGTTCTARIPSVASMPYATTIGAPSRCP